jgi:SAM-dependent methyltransferase
MDQYTSDTKRWLNDRFRKTTENGVFFAHQNIYGFKSPYCEEGVILRYAIFCNVVKALKMLKFDSLLDVGGAEGYMSAVVKKLFDVKVRSCDLSDEACKRAKEIFDVDADPVDSVSLPYPDSSFDILLCSESLEHIPKYEAVLKELLRVARKAVVVTVPHDGPKAVAENIRNKVPHGHIHDFTLASFKDLVPASYKVRSWGLWSSMLKLPFRLVEGRRISTDSRKGIKRLLVEAINPFIVLCGKFLNKTAFKTLLLLDPFLSNQMNTYRQVVFLIVKDPTYLSDKDAPDIDVDEILNFKVPLYTLK